MGIVGNWHNTTYAAPMWVLDHAILSPPGNHDNGRRLIIYPQGMLVIQGKLSARLTHPAGRFKQGQVALTKASTLQGQQHGSNYEQIVVQDAQVTASDLETTSSQFSAGWRAASQTGRL